MTKYLASPHYAVIVAEGKTIDFDCFGCFETGDQSVIDALDTLVPTYIKRIDEPKQPESPKVEQPKEDEKKPEEKPSTRRKASAK